MRKEAGLKSLSPREKHPYIWSLAAYGLSSVISPLQLSFAVPRTKEDAVGGAFDPPLDMAGDTADMVGEEGKGSSTLQVKQSCVLLTSLTRSP